MRLINADELPVVTECCMDEAGYLAKFKVVHEEDIKKAPTIEAEPVKHGRWERVPSNGIGGTARCSICGKAIYGYHTMNYCPNCGANMDLEEQSNE